MLKKEALELAKEIKSDLQFIDFNSSDIGIILHSFELDGCMFNVFAYVGKAKDEFKHKFYSIYSGVEYDGGDNVYANYDYSTYNFKVSEIADSLFKLANYYENDKNFLELKQIIKN